MTYKAYIDNIKTQTGKGPEQYLAMVKREGLTKHSELLAWLKTDSDTHAFRPCAPKWTDELHNLARSNYMEVTR